MPLTALVRAGDRTLIARVRRHVGIDPTSTDLTDAELDDVDSSLF